MTLRLPFYLLLHLLVVALLAGACGHEQKAPPQALESYEEAAEDNAAVRLNLQGDSALEVGNYLEAMTLYLQSLDSAALEGDSTVYYDSKLDIACVHFRNGDLGKAVEVAEIATEAFFRSGDSTRMGRALDALAGYYSKNNQPEKAKATAAKGFEITSRHGDLIHRCVAYNQRAFLYSDAGDWHTARFYLDTALMLMNESGILDQRAGMYLNLGDCYRNLGNWERATFYLRAAEREADSLGHTHILARSIQRLSEVAEARGDVVSALQLYKKSVSLRDSIFKADKAAQLQELESSYEAREKTQQIETLASENKATRAHRNFAISLALLVSSLAFFGIYQYRVKLKNAQKTLEQNQAYLTEYAELLMVKNARLTALEQQSDQQQPVSSVAELTAEQEGESLYNSRILTDSEWEQFKRRFENAYPGYLLNLRNRFPALSNAEERLCLLIKLGFNSQEIADTLGITANAVKKGRQRLRRRLELQPNEELEQFILQLKL